MRVAVVALVVALCASARADDKPTVADPSVGLIVQGGGSLRVRVEERLAKLLEGEGYTSKETPLPKAALETIANCFIIEDLVCARGVFEARSRSPRLVFARIEDTTESTTIDVTWFSKGHEPVHARETCADCADNWKKHTDALFATVSAQAQLPIIDEVQPDPEVPRKRPSKVWSRLLVGAGAATVIAGGVLLYYGLRDGSEYKYVYPQLTPPGIVAIAVGGGAVIGGIITW